MQSQANTSTITSSANSIVLWFAQKLGVKLKDFSMYDPNTFYSVNGIKKRTYTVQANPDSLKYNVSTREKGKSADKLVQQALKKVCKQRYGVRNGIKGPRPNNN